MQGCTNERSNHVCYGQPLGLIYIGEGEGCAPFRVSHPKGAAASLQMASGAAAKRGGRSPSSPRHLGGAFPLEDSSL